MAQEAPNLSPDFGSIPEYLSSYVILFVFCFSTGKAMLAINKGLQRSVFFSLLPLRFSLLIFVHFRCVALFSLSFSLFLLYSLSLRLVTNTDEMIKVINCLSIVVIWIFSSLSDLVYFYAYNFFRDQRFPSCSQLRNGIQFIFFYHSHFHAFLLRF